MVHRRTQNHITIATFGAVKVKMLQLERVNFVLSNHIKLHRFMKSNMKESIISNLSYLFQQTGRIRPIEVTEDAGAAVYPHAFVELTNLLSQLYVGLGSWGKAAHPTKRNSH